GRALLRARTARLCELCTQSAAAPSRRERCPRGRPLRQAEPRPAASAARGARLLAAPPARRPERTAALARERAAREVAPPRRLRRRRGARRVGAVRGRRDGARRPASARRPTRQRGAVDPRVSPRCARPDRTRGLLSAPTAVGVARCRAAGGARAPRADGALLP